MFAVDGYEVVEQLHVGARSIVCRAVRGRDGARVVLKMAAAPHPPPEDRQRLRREFALGVAAEGHGVVEYLDLEAQSGGIALVVEDRGERSVDRDLARGAMPIDEVVDVAVGLAEAIDALHGRGIVHCDVRPSNVLRDPATGAVRLCDLSGAFSGRSPGDRGSALDAEAELAYVSPEQTQRTSHPIDHRTDLYSLGVTLFELLTGHRPFDDIEAHWLIHAHLAKAPPDPRALRPDAPDGLARVILRLLSKNPDDRYPTADGVAADLARIRERWRARADGAFELGATDVSRRLASPERLHGRDRERRRLLACLDALTADTPASLVLVAGPPGIGKSSLVAQLRAPCIASDGYFGAGKFGVTGGAPYAAIAAALRGILREHLAEPAARLDAHRSRLARALGANAAVLTDLFPELAVLLGAVPEAVPLSPRESQNRLRHTLRAFLAALAPPERRVVLVVDDLQWADPASVELLETILDGDARGMLVVGVYRDGELDAAHPLQDLRARAARSAGVVELTLGPLSDDEVGDLVASGLAAAPDDVAPIAAVVAARTRGNPLFVGQLLQALIDARAVRFVPSRDRWTIDVTHAGSVAPADDVVDLMLARLNELGEPARDVLRHAACMREPFDRETLRELLGPRGEALDEALDEAVGAALLAPIEPDALRFRHDRVRQAALRLVDDATRDAISLRLGRLLLARAEGDPAQLELLRFDILAALNATLHLVTDCDERARVAALNRDGARRARRAGAHATARGLVDRALDALGGDAWTARYDLTLELHVIRAEALYLLGDGDALDEALREIRANARSILDALPAHELEIRALAGAYRAREAVAAAVPVLRALGHPLDIAPSRLDVVGRVLSTKWRLRGRDAPSLLSSPPATDPRACGAMRVLDAIAFASFVASPNLFPVVCAETLRLTVRYGLAPQSASAFSAWAMVLVAGLGDIAGGTAASELALALTGDGDARALEGRALAAHGAFVAHWTRHVREVLGPLERAQALSLALGDHEAAMLALVSLCSYLIVAGDPLDEVARAHHKCLDVVRRLRQARFEQDFQRSLQLIACLEGRAPDPAALRGEHFDDDAALASYEREGDTANVALLSYMQALLAFLHDDDVSAERLVARAQANVESQSGSAFRPQIELLTGLVAARAAASSRRARARARRDLDRAITRMRRWARACEANNAHRLALLEAERDALRGKDLDAIRGYERAARLAGASRFVQEKAMTHEAAARHLARRGEDRLARGHLEDARRAYLSWGATAKVAQMERAHAALLTPRVRSLLPPRAESLMPDAPTTRTVGDALDIDAVVRAAQAVSRELVLDRLPRTILAIATQAAGAERAALVLDRDGALELVAEGSAGADADAPPTPPRPVADAVDVVPASLITLVARTREAVVLADASVEPAFARDPYVASRGPRSALCLPLLAQGALVGVVYLENNLARGAFTAGRAELVRILAAQAAVALQNARLYGELRRSLAQQVELTDAQARFVPNEFLRSLNRDDIRGVALGENVRKEMSVLFSDIRGFTALVEGMSPSEHIGFINEYLGYMEPAILGCGGFVDSYIGDAIMALFGGPAADAVRAGVAMCDGLRRLNARRAADGLPPICMGIGVSTGPVTLGTIGGPQRVKCGVIGDTVNLASRIESLTKVYDTAMLIGDATHDRLVDPADPTLRLVDRVTVAGKRAPVTLYEVLDAEPDERRERKRRNARALHDAAEAYFARDFAGALRGFRACLDAWPDDRAAERFAARCARHLAHGVDDAWTGVESLEKK